MIGNHNTLAHMEPPTVADDARQCAAFPCGQIVYGRDVYCEDHGWDAKRGAR